VRILIVTTLVPFVRGGAEMQAEGLASELRRLGHEADIAAIPFKWYPPERLADHMLACRMLDLTESCGEPIDRLIALKFPAYLVHHPNKVLWLAHQHRAAYDGWVGGTSELQHEPLGAHVRELIQTVDRNVLPEARAIYTVSQTVSARLQSFCGFASEPVYHPPPHADSFRPGDYGDYFLMPSRITPSKRQGLVLEAMERTTTAVRLCFLGPAEGPRAAEEFRRRIETSRVADRVSWLGNVSEARKVEAYANCRGVIFPPIDEDYGYITLEAMLAAKPVITCSDSGGSLEWVTHEGTGLVCTSSADGLAAAMDALWHDSARARQYGLAGRQAYEQAGISWERALSCLLA
jgi:glycosyltransferase involved in cell wall biosynthesis